MSLDLSRIENARQRGEKIIARCPACAEHGHDEKGEHLVIMPDGRFGCVTCPGAAGKEHRQRIHALAGDKTTSRRGACMIRVRKPAPAKPPEIPACKPAPPHASQPVPPATNDEPKRLGDVIEPDLASAFMRQLIGDRLPAMSKRLGLVQAATDCFLTGGWCHEDSKLACDLGDVNHQAMTVAAVHAGMVLVGALYAGQDAQNAGETATEAFCRCLGFSPDYIRKAVGIACDDGSYPGPPPFPDESGRFGRVSQTYALREGEDNIPKGMGDKNRECITRSMGAKPSEASGVSDSPATCRNDGQSLHPAPDIDPATGYPIIDGAICPF